MRKSTIAGAAFAAVLLLVLGVAAGYRLLQQFLDPAAATSPEIAPATAPAGEEAHPPAETHQGFLYGRITTLDGAQYEGRLRWGGDEEAFWSDYFNGGQRENPWLSHVPPERLPEEHRPRSIFGIEIGGREGVARLFMVRFGEIARVEAQGREVRVTLKNGTAFDLDRFEASDFDDGVRVWDGERGVVDLESLQIRTIELLPTPRLEEAPYRLHGTVRTRRGDFTGFVGWDWNDSVGTDRLDGRTADGELGLRWDTIGSIARRSGGSALVTLLDGREIVLADDGNRGITVDDQRYGRVTISWDAFERFDSSPGGSGPAYGDFPPGRPLTGSVTTRSGRRLAGRLVYDLDESETVETLDAWSEGVYYTIPFGLIASIVPPGREGGGAQRATVTLHGGEELQLERRGDLREENAGVLVFVDGGERPQYVPWTDVEKIDLDRPPAMYPPLDGR